MNELSVLDWIQGASPTLDVLMVGISTVTSYAAIWLISAFVMTCSPRYRRMGVAVIVSVAVVSLVVDMIMKPYFDRVRPFEVTGFPLIVDVPTSESFPSGHTAYSFAAATAILIYDRRLGIVAMILACLTGFSRMYLYVHWPTDVLAGAVVGVMVAVACVWFMSRYIPYYMGLENPRESIR